MIGYETLKNIVDSIEYLKSLNPESIEEIEKIAFVYGEGLDYCDFQYAVDDNIVLEGSFCINDDETFELSTSFSVLDKEGNSILEIE